MTTPDQRLAAELLAVADALRSVRVQLCRRLLSPLAPDAFQHVRKVTVEGLDVAAALEALAGLLAEAERHPSGNG